MAYQCDSQDGAEGAVVITNIAQGDVLALCGPCFMQWVDATYHAMFDGPADDSGESGATDLPPWDDAPDSPDSTGDSPGMGGESLPDAPEPVSGEGIDTADAHS
jgi:hypothetical protein